MNLLILLPIIVITLLSQNLLAVNFDLLPIEAMCVAKCYSEFTKSIQNADHKKAINSQPESIEDYCETQSSSCRSCLTMCQGQDEANVSCQAKCDQILHSDSTQQKLGHHWFNKALCDQICEEKRMNINRYYIGKDNNFSVDLTCPSRQSWSTNCHLPCTTDQDCMGIGMKCCHDNHSCANRTPEMSRLDLNYREEQKNSSYFSNIGLCLSGVMKSTNVPPPIPTDLVLKTILRPSVDVYDARGKTHDVVVELTWLNFYSVMSYRERSKLKSSIVFLLQVRQFNDVNGVIDANPDILKQDVAIDELFSAWYNLKLTSLLLLHLEELNEKTWYQFRIQSFNQYGTGGWSKPTKPFQLKGLEVPMSVPQNLIQTKTLVHDKLVDVSLAWRMSNDKTFDSLKILWCEFANNRCLWSLIESNLEKNERKYTIRNLKPSTTYQVQIISKINIGHNQTYESKPSTLVISTTSIESKSNSYYDKTPVKVPLGMTDNSCICDMNKSANDYYGSNGQRFITAYPYWENEELKAKLKLDIDKIYVHKKPSSGLYTVEWIPHACIDTSADNANDIWKGEESKKFFHTKSASMDANSLNSYLLTNLKFQCHYKIILHPIDYSQQSLKDYEGCFCTPSCHKIEVVDGSKPPINCFKTENQAPYKPMNIAYNIQPSKHMRMHKYRGVSWPKKTDMQNDEPIESYDVLITWSYPQFVDRKSATTPTGYRITYGPRIYEPLDPIMYQYGLKPRLDYEKSITRVLGPDEKRITLENLDAGKLYIVTLQTTSNKFDSEVESIYFSTPSVSKKTASNSFHRRKQSQYSSSSASTIIPSVLLFFLVTVILILK